MLSWVTIQFIVLTIEVSVQLAILFKGILGLIDKPGTLIETALYLSTPEDVIFKIGNVCSLINVGKTRSYSQFGQYAHLRSVFR